MKSISTFVFSLLSICISFAQTSGVISYSETMKMNITIDSEETGGMDLSEFLPKSMTTNSDLFFDGKISSYKKANSENENMELGDEDAGIKIVFMSDDVDSEIYIDHKAKLITEQKGFIVQEKFDQ